MPRVVSASEVKARFGEIVKWATQNQDEVIVKLYGEPTVVILPYTEYEAVAKLRRQEQKRKVLEALEELRKEVRRQNPALTAAEAYRLAGFSDEVSAATRAKDDELAATTP